MSAIRPQRQRFRRPRLDWARLCSGVARILIPAFSPETGPHVVGGGTGFLFDGGQPLEQSLFTAAHVVRGCRRPLVQFGDGSLVQGTVLGAARFPDLARIGVPRLPAGVEPLRARDELGGPPVIGERLRAVAFAWGDEEGHRAPCVLEGRVVNDDSRGVLLDYHSGPGASGGPVLDRDGRVVGIQVGGLSNPASAGGVGCMVPTTSAVRVLLGELLGGDAAMGWMGFERRPLDPALQLANGQSETRQIVAAPTPLGPADRAGLRLGDHLLSARNIATDDQALVQGSARLAEFDFQCRLRSGHRVDVAAEREGRPLQLTLAADTAEGAASTRLRQRLNLPLIQGCQSIEVYALTIEHEALTLDGDWHLPVGLELARYTGWRRAWRRAVWRLPRLSSIGRSPVLRCGSRLLGVELLEQLPATVLQRRRGHGSARIVAQHPLADLAEVPAALEWLASVAGSDSKYLGGIVAQRGESQERVYLPAAAWQELLKELVRRAD
jgi:S1-C subfamily serine protease